MPRDSRLRSAGGELILAKLCWIEDPDRRGADETKLVCGDCVPFIDPDKDLLKWKRDSRFRIVSNCSDAELQL